MHDDVDSISLVNQIDTESATVVVPEGRAMPVELDGERPRPVPAWIRSAPRIRRPWLLSWSAVIAFGIAVASGANPFGQPWARIAFWSMFIVGMVGIVGLFTARADLRYVRSGLTGAGRVISVQLVPLHEYNGQTISWQHILRVAVQLSSGATFVRRFSGLPISSDDRDGLRIAIRQGDVIPIIWLPGRFEKTVRPYAFLKFNYDRALVRSERVLKPRFKKLLTAASVVAIFAVLIGNLLLFMWCIPVAFSVPVVAAIGIAGGLLIGTALIYVIVREFQKEDQQAAARNRQAAATGGPIEYGSSHAILTNTWLGWIYRLGIGLGSLLMGGITLVMWVFGLNMLIDRGPGVDRVITILERRERPGNSGTIQVRFQPLDEPNGRYSKDFAPRDLPDVPLVGGANVLVEWHSGAFGWPWVDKFRRAPAPENAAQ